MGKFIDLTGQQFERLKVIKRVGSDKWGRPLWLCKCDCNGENSEKIIKGQSLRSGNTQSCGCLHTEIRIKIGKANKKYNTYDLSGEYGIGYTLKGEEFWFDLEDYDKIKNYCWYKNDDGYIIFKSDNEYIRMHRLVMNAPNDMEVDHIYHQTYDNRKSELRLVTDSQNSINQIISKNNTSGVKGVSWDNKNEKWRARITVNNKGIWLGRFDNFEDAVYAREQAEEEYFGEYKYKETVSCE